ncbi:bifunctional adenosylcobinamide kinase/adenosylcobinamide-phosphate guanylyltransferase [Jannaschia pohangensis]|uniref:Bifunctional adenosylcobalamin biosynthesis protein n=1 Tax=Jannaschia pohangensis TaxID=390807 RepID=A0A1I3QT17_9RHOB|nr:bifunctional adenosylcobinamide kinase/adenosylcobinamide-phosphate guanylyltransferase [Jannaschia pohangensis]SFJ36401.1 adenosylcobinamide kinase /adenosylcobinamide-phosphate guanylyltransferase [Jannaschia pohangensis]
MSDSSHITVVLGHAASGKSRWAEDEVDRLDGAAIYVATARIWDAEMGTKVAAHAARRGTGWALIEEPLDLATVCAARQAGEVVLIDCATLWLTNLMMDDIDWQAAALKWFSAMSDSPATFVVVTNDVGGGVTPDNAMARQFQRMQGQLNQELAALADRVILVTAGLAQVLK